MGFDSNQHINTINESRRKKVDSRTVRMAQTLMDHSPELARTIIMVPTCHFRHNPPWMGGTTFG